MPGTLQDSDVLAALNAVEVNGKPLTPATLATFFQYGLDAMLRDFYQAQAATQAATNAATANAGAQAVAQAQNSAQAQQAAIATLLGGLSL